MHSDRTEASPCKPQASARDRPTTPPCQSRTPPQQRSRQEYESWQNHHRGRKTGRSPTNAPRTSVPAQENCRGDRATRPIAAGRGDSLRTRIRSRRTARKTRPAIICDPWRPVASGPNPTNDQPGQGLRCRRPNKPRAFPPAGAVPTQMERDDDLGQPRSSEITPATAAGQDQPLHRTT